jgi:hypothetical protein
MNDTKLKQVEFEKLQTGSKFYLGNPTNLPDNAAYIKMETQKDHEGKWTNAKNVFGMVIFIQYDKRVWQK